MSFDILDHIAGRTFPDDTVPVYFDEKSAREIEKLEAAANLEKDGEKVAEYEKQIEGLKEQVEKTALTFHMQGFPEKVKDALLKDTNAKFPDAKGDDEERNEYMNVEAIRLATVKITNAKGEEAKLPDFDQMQAIYTALPTSQKNLLVQKVTELSYQSTEFELSTVNPDFS